ncbi:thioester reductase domain-containing protein [Actinomadura gamaensis]|uniref:Thioester reductase domain-containing protein n=1 Tax=Actinomadura gamaensis TaxID=1763541 RepID=A0ABV9UD84_9ACTN
MAAESATGTEASDPPRGGTEETVARLWAEQLGLERIGRRDDFFAVGGESLQAVRFVTALRNELRLDDVPGRLLVRMLLDTPVLHRFAERLDAARDGRVEPDRAPVDLHAEARLDPSLHFGEPPPAGTTDPQAVLLTGATGFLGAFLTRRFLDDTTARLYCPVRATDPDDGLRRIAAALRRYELPLTDLEQRVTAVPADLAEPRLGLDAHRFAQLADQVEVILHNGAHVNFLYPYSRLAAANVGGVRELIRLAAAGDPKPFHYVSSIAVHAGLGTTGRRQMPEDDPLGDPELLGQGYAETKWVAETMLRAAAEQGLPVSLYRPGEITGTRDRGVQGTGTMLSALFKAITDTGLAPAVPYELNLIPVEVAAEALVRLLLTAPARGHAYHLVNPAPAPLSLLVERAETLGYRIRQLPYDQWLREMNRYTGAEPAAPIADYLPMFSERSAKTGLSVFEASFPGNMPDLATSNFTDAAGDTKIPAVDADLLDRYLRYWLSSGFLTPPTSPSEEAAAPPGNRHS